MYNSTIKCTGLSYITMFCNSIVCDAKKHKFFSAEESLFKHDMTKTCRTRELSAVVTVTYDYRRQQNALVCEDS
jgi:hypothetical protein